MVPIRKWPHAWIVWTVLFSAATDCGYQAAGAWGFWMAGSLICALWFLGIGVEQLIVQETTAVREAVASLDERRQPEPFAQD